MHFFVVWFVSYWHRFLKRFQANLPDSVPESYHSPQPSFRRKPRTTQADYSSDEQPTDPFLIKLCRHIDANITNSGFGVGELAGQMGLSRIHLYRKIKGLTGMTATEFLRNYRLKTAISYLRAGHTVSETSHLVGFESPAYFTKCFRECYHMPPTVFRDYDSR